MPGCFTPTEILDAWDAGADIVKVFPATALGPGYIKDVRGAAAAGQADADRRRHARQRRRLDSRPARSRSASARALLDAKAIAAGDYRRRCAPTPSASWRKRPRARRSRRHDAKVVTFGEIMLRLSPPGFERFLQSPRSRRDLRRRRSQRRGQPRAVRPRELTTSRGCRRTRSATPRSARCAPKACAPTTSCAAASGIGIYFAEAGASQRASHGHLRPRPLGDQRDGAGRRRLAGGVRRRARGSTSPASRRRSAPRRRVPRARARGRHAPPACASASTSTSARSCGPRSRRRR